ncbi:MAG: hypothetical protein A2142_01835 [candidate division Zixibacteria bacterium RBG_16_48_11]|nr:MAG: hypothetical protein A2142_01835 [candidate division Zixibacteria bacterium RBG_16_48_11]
MRIREPSDPLVDIIAIEVPLRNRVQAFDKTDLINFDKLSFGEQVYFIGYPLWDIKTLPEYVKRPILRHGIISYKSSDTLIIGNDTLGSELFLIDGFAWPGNSGSPVMVRMSPYEGLQGMYSKRGVVGIIFKIATFRPTRQDTLKSNEINSGLSIALPSDRIHELLNMFNIKP